jgi:DNA-binding MarR family transcriptional regulator
MPITSSRRPANSAKPLPPVSDADYEHLAAFRRALREFLHFSEQAAMDAGLPAQQHQAMLAIRGLAGSDSMTVGMLADRLKIRHHSAVGLVNRMEADGFLKKTRNPENGREVFVTLTARGKRKLEALSPVHKAELARVGPSLRAILEKLEA